MNEDWREDLLRIPAKGLLPLPGCNPRRRFDEAKMAELVASVRAKGVREPLLVHDNWGGESIPELPRDHRFWIVAGERRWRAASEVGPDTEVPCLVSTYTMAEALEIALVENLERHDLTIVEEARGYQRLLENMTQRELADRLGRAQPTIANALRLLQLPDELLEHVESGTIAPSHARDYLLPFAKIPEGKREKLFAAVIKNGKEWAKRGEPAMAGELQTAVAHAAERLSHPIVGREYDQDKPLFEAKEHESCSCNGPKFGYGWRGAEVRCFDDDWWKAAQAEARKRLDEEERARDKKLKAIAGEAAAAPRMTRGAFEKRYGWNGGTKLEVRDNGYGLPTLLDAAELADAPMVVVQDGYGGPEVRCVDQEAVKRAKGACTRVRNQLLKERRGERAERYLQEAAKLEIEPWMLGVILSERPQNDTLLAAAREIGIDVGKHGELHGNLVKLPDEQVTILFKVLALRARNKDLSAFQDPLERQVDQELVKRYAPGIAGLKRRALAKPKDKTAAAADAAADCSEAVA